MAGYFVSHQGRQLGPMEFNQIEAQLNDKLLFPTDFVYIADDATTKTHWMPILDFILVYGPKKKVVETRLQTEGARHSSDADIDWKRFAVGLPVKTDLAEEKSDKEVYPSAPTTVPTPSTLEAATGTPDFPPPPAPPRAVVEKRILQDTARKRETPARPPIPQTRPPIPNARPPIPRARPPAPRPEVTATASRSIDLTATAKIEVLPPKATKLQIQIQGDARVGEMLNLTVMAMSESGAVDKTFDGIVHIGCDRPVQGLLPMRFTEGVARLQVLCLASGQHQFYLSLDPMNTPGRPLRNYDFNREVAH